MARPETLGQEERHQHPIDSGRRAGTAFGEKGSAESTDGRAGAGDQYSDRQIGDYPRAYGKGREEIPQAGKSGQGIR